MKIRKIMTRATLFCLTLCCLIWGCDRKSDSFKKSDVILNQRSRSKIQTLDPSNVGDVPTDEICSEFYECLYTYHFLKRPNQVIPQLAINMPDISEDDKVYRIEIRRDVYFHDDPCFPDGKGRLLKAQDFVYAWMRIADIKVNSKNWWIFDDKIVGLDDFREYTKTAVRGQIDYTKQVEGLYAEDDFTLVVKLTRPWPQFIYWLAHVPTAPMAKEAVDYYGPDIVSHPVGTGAYQLKKWQRGIYVEAVRNPNYRPFCYPSEGMPGDVDAGYLTDAGLQVPFIDRVIWRIVVEDSPRWLLLMRGDVDINTISKDNFGEAVSMGRELTDEMRQRGMELKLFDEPDTFWIGINMHDPVLGKNRPLRYAINHAINRERFIELVESSRGKPAYGIIPTIMAGYDETIQQWSPCQYDVAKAREYLKQAEQIHGGKIPKMRLAIGRTGPVQRQRLQFLKRNLEEIGIEVELEIFDWPTFLDKLRNASHQLFFSGWMADYPDVENFLSCFYSKNASWPNSTNYNNPEFDALFETISVMPDTPERTELYRKSERMILNDMPCVPVYHRIAYIIHHGWLKNIKPDPYKAETMGAGKIKYYRVDTEKRDEYRKTFK